jgi:hypothetical protein
MKNLFPFLIIEFLKYNGIKFTNKKESINEKDNFIKLANEPKFTCKLNNSSFGAQVDNVKVTFSDYFKKEDLIQIRPAPESYNVSIYYVNYHIKIDSDIIYEKIENYPEQRFTYIVRMGLKSEEHVLYLLLNYTPFITTPKKDYILLW